LAYRTLVRDTLIASASIAVFITSWWAVVRMTANPFLPDPYQVLIAFFRISTVGDIDGYTLGWHAMNSLYRILLGFIAGGITAIPLGILMGIRPFARSATSPIVEPLRFIPPIAWIPLSIILLSGLSRYVFIIWIGVFFPVLLNSIAGVRRTSVTLVNMAKTFGSSSSEVIRKIIFPSALPEIMTGLRVGLGVGWMSIVAAEMIGGEPVGLGRLILKYADLLQLDVVVMGMITIGIVGLAMNYFILLLEKRLFRWRTAVSA